MLEQGQRLPVHLANTGIHCSPVIPFSIANVLRYIESKRTLLLTLSYVFGRSGQPGAFARLRGQLVR